MSRNEANIRDALRDALSDIETRDALPDTYADYANMDSESQEALIDAMHDALIEDPSKYISKCEEGQDPAAAKNTPSSSSDMCAKCRKSPSSGEKLMYCGRAVHVEGSSRSPVSLQGALVCVNP